MKGFEHQIEIVRPGSVENGYELTRITVLLVNEGDPHYTQIFETPAELDLFIEELKAARTEAFGY